MAGYSIVSPSGATSEYCNIEFKDKKHNSFPLGRGYLEYLFGYSMSVVGYSFPWARALENWLNFAIYIACEQ